MVGELSVYVPCVADVLLDETAGAIHTLDTFLQTPQNPKSVELMAMLASIRATSRPGMSDKDKVEEKVRARDLFDRVCKSIGASGDGLAQLNGQAQSLTPSARNLGEDTDMFIEIAKLYQDESIERMERAYKQALENSKASGKTEPRLVNNLGALQHLEGHFDEARTMYEDALTHAASLDQSTAEAMSTSILYNLARVYEDQAEVAKAKEAYDKLLTRHPEYADGGYLAELLYSRAYSVHQPRSGKRRCSPTSTSTMKRTSSSSRHSPPNQTTSTFGHTTRTFLSSLTRPSMPKTSSSSPFAITTSMMCTRFVPPAGSSTIRRERTATSLQKGSKTADADSSARPNSMRRLSNWTRCAQWRHRASLSLLRRMHWVTSAALWDP